uniref:Immunoglobulin domain-containing protein n=1 Tax=Knipowitschia caucasica TaxID=637954 RepID=A0AAV2M9P4_KNICA
MIQKNRGLSAALICVVLALLPQGSQALLELSASGPDVASVLVGGNVTLGVSYSRASNAAIIWRRGLDPVATWTINTSAPPDIHPGLASVLGVSANGSLQFVGVTLDYSGGYSVEMTKSGQGTATLNFTLTVYGQTLRLDY